jgi:hypothetical protein
MLERVRTAICNHAPQSMTVTDLLMRVGTEALVELERAARR